MRENRYAEVRERTGLTTYAFGSELEARGLCTRDYYYRIERGAGTPKIGIENAIIRLNAELRGVSFNEVLLELRGVSSEPQLQAAV